MSQEDLEELTAKTEPDVDVDPELEVASEENEVSLDQISESEKMKSHLKKQNQIVNY